MSKVNKIETEKVVRTSEGLRDAIFDEIDAIRNGTSNPTRASAVARLAAGIIDTVRMEMEVKKYMNGVVNELDKPKDGKPTNFSGLLLGSND